MADQCSREAAIRDATPSALGCEECLRIGSPWVHLRLCRTCGHVGCCADSPNRHATRHFRATGHPIIEGYDPPEGWGWCYIDEVMLDLSDRVTPHNGPIPRYYSAERTLYDGIAESVGDQIETAPLRREGACAPSEGMWRRK